MKKLTTLCLMALMSISMFAAPSYLVQTGQPGDSVWSQVVVDSLKATLVNLKDSTKEFDEWVNTLPAEKNLEIWMAAGTYYVSTGITAVKGYLYYGGFAGTEYKLEDRALVAGGKAWEFANATTIDGDGVRIFLKSKNFENSVLNGLILKNGLSSDENAGVVRAHNNAKFENCQFINNKTTKSGGQGGALQTYNAKNIVVRNCYFEGNQAVQGGAVYINNAVDYVYTIENCYFKDNYASGTANAGGAIQIQGKCNTTINACVFEGNDAAGAGATISSDAKGDVKAYTKISNCLISGSKSVDKQAVYLAEGAIYNNTFVNNAGGAIYTNNTTNGAKIINNIVWGTTKVQGKTSILDKAVTEVKNNAFLDSVKLKTAVVADNMVIDTLAPEKYFVDAANGNYQLFVKAPMIDAGLDLSAEGDTLDLLGKKHEVGAFDMGCYEYTGAKYVAVASVTLNKEVLFVAKDGAKKLTAAVAPNDATFKTVTWTSLDTTIAKVSGGQVKGIALGETKVVAQAEDATDTCVVKVVAVAPDYLVQSGDKDAATWADAVVTATGGEVIDIFKTGSDFDAWVNTVAASEIWMAAGTYYVSAGITAVKGYKYYGGFAGTETKLEDRALVAGGKAWEFANATTIDGDGVRIFLKSKNFENSVLNGLTIKNGLSSDENAGVVRAHANAKFENCQFINNKTTKSGGQGGALQTYNGKNIIVRNCYFEGNQAVQGGALYINNAVDHVYTIENCYFKDNYASGTANAGGAIQIQGKCNTTINACVFEGNNAAGTGATISSDAKGDAKAYTKISNCLISGSKSVDKQAVYLAEGAIYNNTFVNNAGGAIYTNNTTNGAKIINNIVWGTTKVQGKTSILDKAVTEVKNNAFLDSVKLKNAVVADNAVLDTLTMAYFADAANGDFHLANDVAALCLIQKGMDLSEAGVVTDLEGTARVAGKYDMGCYVYVGEIPTAIETIQSTKTIINGVKYNVLGQPVGDDYRGIVIMDGKKYIVR